MNLYSAFIAIKIAIFTSYISHYYDIYKERKSKNQFRKAP